MLSDIKELWWLSELKLLGEQCSSHTNSMGSNVGGCCCFLLFSLRLPLWPLNYLIQFLHYWIAQWALKLQININIWSISWHNINRPDFDILLMSDGKYHMDINTWGQCDVKSVSRKWQMTNNLVEKEFWLKNIWMLKNNFG